jgi:hypothetical protein
MKWCIFPMVVLVRRVATTFSSVFRSFMMSAAAASHSPTAARVLVADGGPLPVVCACCDCKNLA